eukprot:gene13012-biopygen8036
MIPPPATHEASPSMHVPVRPPYPCLLPAPGASNPAPHTAGSIAFVSLGSLQALAALLLLPSKVLNTSCLAQPPGPELGAQSQPQVSLAGHLSCHLHQLVQGCCLA